MTDSKGYHVLIIEDNPGDFILVEDLLFEQITAPVITYAETFKAAHEILCSRSCRFDIILLDLSLPDKTGESLIKEIVGCCNNVPIVVLTGYADFDFGVRSLSLGVSDYILKDDLTSLSLYKSIIYSIERKKSTQALRESEKRYSDIFDLSPLPMWIVELDTLKFLDVNKATVYNYGYSREELLSMTLRDIRPADDIARLERVIKEGKKQSKPHTHDVTMHIKKNGEQINVDVQYAQINFKGVLANIAIVNDITERLNYIKTIEAQNENLKEISWMQSHVIRAPLSRIMGLIPLIIDSKSSNADKEVMLNYLEVSANDLDDVIKSITDKTNKQL
jgi:PAS domain S-box-containing protein